MLDELIKTMDYGVSYGSGALKSLQNYSLPELELLVREAIQNSSDASRGIDYKSVSIHFNTGTFQSEQFNELFSSIKELLNKRYAEKPGKFLEIRDFRTSGLTGPVKLSQLNPDDHENYFKLIFDTGKEQTSSGVGEAGGSYGYGKSVYYRVGIGLVCFYSQIKTDNGYEERLIFSLVEHETADNSMLKMVKKDSVGRAWWGKIDPINKNELLPLTDPNEIQTILDIFGLQRFKQDQTGTAIIIPYIDEVKLLEGIFPDDCGVPDSTKQMCFWKDSVKDYLELAIEKWYAPRIFNKQLENIPGYKWLGVRVDGKPIKYNTMRPFFQLCQDLYNTALFRCYGKEYKSEKFAGIECISIPSQKVEGNKSGYAAYIRIKDSQLSSTGSMIKPYVYLRLFDKSALNDPIVMFTRTPGMILDYKIDGKWAKSLVKPENDDEYIIVFYVPDCTKRLKKDKSILGYSGQNFEKYLRECEKSDHMEWDDKSNLTIITNIKTQLCSKVNNGLRSENSGPVEGTASKLSGKLGKRLLPNINFGKTSGKGPGGGSGGGGGSSANLNVKFVPIIIPDGMIIEFDLLFSSSRKSAAFGLFVETETGVMNAETWENNIGNSFPIHLEEISEITVTSENTGKKCVFNKNCNQNNKAIENDFSKVELIYTKSGNIISGFQVENDITHARIIGKLVIKTTDRKCVLAIKEIKN